MSILEEVLNIIGEIPTAYMPVAWVFAALILIFILVSFFNVIAGILRIVGGGR